MQDFSTIYRNPGHWDIVNKNGRLFRIRGDIGDVWVSDERPMIGEVGRREAMKFRTVAAAMAYITDILMFEPLASNNDSLIDSEGNLLIAIKME